MSKTVAIVQARMGSTRLPGKVMMELRSALGLKNKVVERVVNSARLAAGVDDVCLATTTSPADDEMVEYMQRDGCTIHRGSETDVLARFAGAAEQTDADVIIRITADCPFIDPEVIGAAVALRRVTGASYVSNIDPPTWPDGLDCEVFTKAALSHAHRVASRPVDRDCVTPFIARNRSIFMSRCVICPIPGLHKERWVLDTAQDLAFCEFLARRLPESYGISYLDILAVLDNEPHLREMNRPTAGPRNERYFKALADEEPVYDRAVG